MRGKTATREKDGEVGLSTTTNTVYDVASGSSIDEHTVDGLHPLANGVFR